MNRLRAAPHIILLSFLAAILSSTAPARAVESQSPAVFPSPDTFTVQISTAADDARENADGTSFTDSTLALQMGDNGSVSRVVGLRFTGVTVPPGAYITSAVITFTASASDSGSTSLSISGHDVGNSSAFAASDGPADRLAASTAAAVVWSPPDWSLGATYQTADITAISQEIVNRSDWASGNALSIMISDGDGVNNIQRRAVAHDSNPSQAAQLEIIYQTTPNIIEVTTTSDVFDAGGLVTSGPPCWITGGVIDPALLPGADGEVTLREAICAANGDPAANTITFNIFGPGPHTLENFWGNMPVLVDDGTTIDGTTQPGYAGSPVVELAQGGLGDAALIIEGGNALVRGLAITGWVYSLGGGSGIIVRNPTASGAIIEDNYIGLEPDGVTPDGNFTGIGIGDGAAAIIQDNVVSGNEYGIYITSDNNLIQNNLIGTDTNASAAVGNPHTGIVILGPWGGTATGNQILNNVISASIEGEGIYMGSGAQNNVVQGNKIGTDALGTTALGNWIGVMINGTTGDPNWLPAQDNLIGGTDPGQRNIISGNLSQGVVITQANALNNQIMGNYIGTDVTGMAALSNGYGGPSGAAIGNGVQIDNGASDNTVADNIIAANGRYGIEISFADNNIITGNTIGENAAGGPLGNGSLDFIDYSPVDSIPDSYVIYWGYGVLIDEGSGNLISQNTIAHNASDAVNVTGGTGNTITQNSMHNNGAPGDGYRGMGINLYDCCPSPGTAYFNLNDAGDADTGPNDLLNHPEFTSLTTTLAEGTACDGCTVELFITDGDPPSYGEGMTFLAAGTASGGTFSVDLSASGVTFCDTVNATATDALGNTSEFSLSLSIGAEITCLSPTEGGFLIGVIILVGAVGGGLGWFVRGKSPPWAVGGFVVGAVLGGVAYFAGRGLIPRAPGAAVLEPTPIEVLQPIILTPLLPPTPPAIVTETATATPTPTSTSTPIPMVTATLTPTPTSTATPTATPVPAPIIYYFTANPSVIFTGNTSTLSWDCEYAFGGVRLFYKPGPVSAEGKNSGDGRVCPDTEIFKFNTAGSYTFQLKAYPATGSPTVEEVTVTVNIP